MSCILVSVLECPFHSGEVSLAALKEWVSKPPSGLLGGLGRPRCPQSAKRQEPLWSWKYSGFNSWLYHSLPS